MGLTGKHVDFYIGRKSVVIFRKFLGNYGEFRKFSESVGELLGTAK